MANGILGDFDSILGTKKTATKVEPFDLKMDQEQPVDLGDFPVEPKPKSPGALDYIEGGARAFDRGILKTPVGVMDIAAAMGSAFSNNWSTPTKGQDITQDKMFKAARAYEGFIDKKFGSNNTLNPTVEAIGEGLGQMGGQVIAATASGGTSTIAQLSKPLAGLTIAGMGTTEAVDDALANKATPAQIKIAAITGTLSGITEFLPVERVLGILDKAAPGVKRKVINILATGGVEGLQEMVQQGMINFGAQLTYDEERSLTKDLAQSGEVGGAVGIIASTIATLVGAKHVKIDFKGPVQNQDMTEPVYDAEIVNEGNLPTPIRRNIEKTIDAEFSEVEKLQLPEPVYDLGETPNISTQVIPQKVYDGTILKKIEEKYSEGSPRQQYAIAYAEKKLRGNENTAETPNVIELGVSDKKISNRSPEEEIANIEKMLQEDIFSEDVKDLFRRRLEDLRQSKVVAQSEVAAPNPTDLESTQATVQKDVDEATALNKESQQIVEKKLNTTPQETSITKALDTYRFQGNNYTLTGDASKPKFIYADGPKKGKLVRNTTTNKMLQTQLESQFFDHIRIGRSKLTRVETSNKSQETSAPKTEIIKASQPFSKLGDSWVAPVDNERSLAIQKEGKFYTVYLGTVDELQKGIAQEVDTYTSLPKARKAMGDQVEVEAAPEKLSKDQLAERLNALKKINETQRQEKIEALLSEDVDEDTAAELVSWEEMADDETAADYYKDDYAEGDFTRDIFDILGNEDGRIILQKGPVVETTIKKLKSMSQKAGDSFSILAKQIDKTWKKIKKYLGNQKGSIDLGPVRGLMYDLAKKIKALHQSLKDHASQIKKASETRKRAQGTSTISSEQQEKDLNAARGMIGAWTSAYKNNMDDAVDAMWQRMMETNRIVEPYEKGSMTPPTRQVPWIYEQIKPMIRPNAADINITDAGAFSRSPSNIFKNFFDTWANPSVDAAEAQMAYVTNVRNNTQWAKDTLKGIPDTSEEMNKILDPLYKSMKEVISERNREILRIGRKTEELRITTDKKKREQLIKQIKAARKRIRLKTGKIQTELREKYDSIVPLLAERFADVRITMQVLEELPIGIKVSKQEIAIADKIRDFFQRSKNDLISVGIPVVNDRQYMHRILPDILSDPDAQGFAQDAKIPLNLKFMHQAEDGRIWYPSMHMILDSYIPMVERKIAYQPFLNRWTEAVDRMPDQLRGYMTKWVNANLFRPSQTRLEKMINNAVMFEYIRLIGGSIAVSVKHASKAADTLARFDMVTNAKAVSATSKAVLQRTSKALGYEGDNKNSLLMKAFVNQFALAKMLDETPSMTEMGLLAKKLAGAPVMATETFDNGITVFATLLAGANKNMTPENASRLIWQTILAANFRGGFDQPLGFKKSGVRLFAMFQMTPHKLWEYRGDIFSKAIQGERDAFGTPYGVILMRYILLFGLAETIARAMGSTIIDLIAHTPYVSHWIEADKKKGYKLHEPTYSPSPLIDWMVQAGDKGVFTATKDHFKYWGQLTKGYNTYNGRFPRKYYTSPITYNLGIKKVGAGHKAAKRR